MLRLAVLLLLLSTSPTIAYEDRFTFHGFLTCQNEREQWCWKVEAIEYDRAGPHWQRHVLIGTDEGCTEQRVGEYGIMGKLYGDGFLDDYYETGLKIFHTCTNGGVRETVGGSPMWYDKAGLFRLHQANFTIPKRLI